MVRRFWQNPITGEFFEPTMQELERQTFGMPDWTGDVGPKVRRAWARAVSRRIRQLHPQWPLNTASFPNPDGGFPKHIVRSRCEA